MARYDFMRYPDGKAKAVTFSYDDGIRPDIHLVKICDDFGIKCTFNINSAFVANLENDFHLTVKEIKDYFLTGGHEVAVHGHDHRAHGVVRPIDTIKDVLQCRQKLEKEFGMIIRGMAYPDSGITRFSNKAEYGNIRELLRSMDIAYCRTLGGDNCGFDLPTDWYAWMPTSHHDNPRVLEYASQFAAIDMKRLQSSERWPRLFYLWGHSFEYENNGNWDHLEKLCGILGGKEDTWYATNMQIYEYVQAYHSLLYSADGNVIYNPTLIKIWFDRDGELYSVNSGETLKL